MLGSFFDAHPVLRCRMCISVFGFSGPSTAIAYFAAKQASAME